MSRGTFSLFLGLLRRGAGLLRARAVPLQPFIVTCALEGLQVGVDFHWLQLGGTEMSHRVQLQLTEGLMNTACTMDYVLPQQGWLQGHQWLPSDRSPALCSARPFPHPLAVRVPVVTSTFQAGRREKELLTSPFWSRKQQLPQVLLPDFFL